MRQTLRFLVGVLATVSIISCSSDDNSDNSTLEDNFKDRSLIKSINITDIYPMMFEVKHKISLSYDASGNLQSIVQEPTNQSSNEIMYENYNWTSDSIHVEFYTSLDYRWVTENYSRNSEGYLTSGEMIYDWFDHWTESIYSKTYIYNCNYSNNNRLLKTSVSYTDNGNLITKQTDYNWRNGNIVSIKKSDYLYEFEYYTDKKETRDLGLKQLSISRDIYTLFPDDLTRATYHTLRAGVYSGNPMFLSKNLLKKYFDEYTSTTIEYSYEFDNKGRVTRQVQTLTGDNIAFHGLPEKTVYVYEYFD